MALAHSRIQQARHLHGIQMRPVAGQPERQDDLPPAHSPGSKQESAPTHFSQLAPLESQVLKF